MNLRSSILVVLILLLGMLATFFSGSHPVDAAYNTASVSAPDNVAYVWSGGVTASSAIIKAKIRANTGTVRVIYSTSSTLTNPTYSTAAKSATVASNRTVAFTIGNLRPSTTYHYAVEVDGVLDTLRRGKFLTGNNLPSSVRFIASADSVLGSNHEIYDGIRLRNPHFMIHMGDLHYEDITVNDPAKFQAAYDSIHSLSRFSNMVRNSWTAYMWDDHDFAGNDSGSNEPSRPAAQSSYLSQVPHFPLDSVNSATATHTPIYQAFSVGRVKFIMTDLRSSRSDLGLTNDASRSMLGATQKAWFKQQLLDAQGPYPLIIWVSTVPWHAAAEDNVDHWGGFHAERVEIANFVKDNNISGLHILSGDAHMLALDDGTNSDYATGGGAPMPVMQAAALSQSGSTRGGPYTHGPFAGTGQFGLFNVSDSGGDSVCIRFRGVRHRNRVDTNLIDWTNCVSAEPVFDYGNLPASFTAGTLAENGARHMPGNWSLGTKIDVERGPGALFSPPADVDGVEMVLRPIPNGTATVRVKTAHSSNPNAIGRVGIWADWNHNGTFDGGNEFTSHNVPVGNTSIVLNVPNTFVPSNGITMRVRLFDAQHLTGNSLDAADFRGVAYDGEVEDYIFLSPTAVTNAVVSAETPTTSNPIILMSVLFLFIATNLVVIADRRQ